jgi:excisionase family DNA binding protein
MLRQTSKTVDPGRPYTVKEAAAYLRVSRATVYQELADGRLKGSKIRKRRIFFQSQLDDYARLLIETTENPKLLRRARGI